MEFVEFGQIVNTHGLKGELKIYPHTNREENILKLKKVYIDDTEYLVEKISMMKNMFKIKLKGVDVVEAAEKLLNKIIKREVTAKEIISSAEENEYFIKDLENMKVYDEFDSYLGILTEVFETGANDVYKVVLESGKEIYLPAIKQVILNVNLKENKMVVKLMEGLI